MTYIMVIFSICGQMQEIIVRNRPKARVSCLCLRAFEFRKIEGLLPPSVYLPPPLAARLPQRLTQQSRSRVQNTAWQLHTTKDPTNEPGFKL